MKPKFKFFRRFAVAGSAIRAALCAYTFYCNARPHCYINEALFLILCPPSIAAFAMMDISSVAARIIVWLLVSLFNGGLYGLGGLMLDYLLALNQK
jgi:hypothetical protein